MGVYDTKALPIYKYLHGAGIADYAIADNFFQGAFGGSFLNHQWLVCARAPIWVGAPNDGGANDLHSVVDANGMPNNYPLYSSPLGGNVKDLNLTASCNPPAGGRAAPSGSSPAATTPSTRSSRPTSRSRRDRVDAAAPAADDADHRRPLTAAKASTGRGTRAAGRTPTATSAARAGRTAPGRPARDPNVARRPRSTRTAPTATSSSTTSRSTTTPTSRPARAARTAHLRDEVEFMTSRRGSKSTCKLKPVSFIKPIGEENEHPGYASESAAATTSSTCSRRSRAAPCAKDTMVIVTYDEFGGQCDHVAPPGTVGRVPGPHDTFGPGTPLPALVLSPMLTSDFVVDSRRARHDLDPDDDREALEPEAARHPRRGRLEPRHRLRGETPEDHIVRRTGRRHSGRRPDAQTRFASRR